MAIRIIGGKFKGKRLLGVKDSRVRPTTDRHRETIFNILSNRVVGVKVLDLFAGTGALGLEALSRGAEKAVFVDISKKAIETLFRNVQACRFESVTRIIRCNIRKSLNCLKEQEFELVFMDPPYQEGAVFPTLKNLSRSDCLNPGAAIVVEHCIEEPITGNLGHYYLYDQRNFGKTLVSFLKYVI